jgi:hypothetical protein
LATKLIINVKIVMEIVLCVLDLLLIAMNATRLDLLITSFYNNLLSVLQIVKILIISMKKIAQDLVLNVTLNVQDVLAQPQHNVQLVLIISF